MLDTVVRRLEALESAMVQVYREGVVVSTDPARGTARVRIPDADNIITNDLRVLVRKTADDQDYWMPDIGDGVGCLFLGNGLENGIILGSFYSDPAPVPVASQHKWHRRFRDGTYLEYDRESHVLTAKVQGRAEITTTGDLTAKAGTHISAEAGDFIRLTAPTIFQNGNVVAGGGSGEAATVTENAHRTITGSLVLNGPLTVNGDSTINGDSSVSGTSQAGSRSGPCPASCPYNG